MSDSKCIRYLRDYVAIPSVNPMGRGDLAAEVVGEARYAGHLLEQFRGLGLDAQQVGGNDRPSVVGSAVVAGARETILIASHLDTVPVDGMEIEPFDPVLRDGRMYGRGSCDTKAGMAAAVAALEKVLADGTLARNVLLVGEADEEFGSLGVRDVIRHLEARRPELIIVTEPTSLQTMTGHKGIAHVRLVVSGSACHSSNPALGDNALYTLARVMTALESRAADLPLDDRLGQATLSVNLAGGGHGWNIVPDLAWLVLDRRMLPGETAATVRAEVEEVLALAGRGQVEIAELAIYKPPLKTAEDHPVVAASSRALACHELPIETGSVAFATDAGSLAEAEMPGIVFGPGSIDQAHTAAEYVEVKQVEQATAVFESLFRAD